MKYENPKLYFFSYILFKIWFDVTMITIQKKLEICPN